ncbi:MAG TPA: hypothetical protein VNO23_09935, partial [Candidatus Binatia bacterium]|nr:hypothetical protein [Candidatus Binatia bacterium]
PTSGVPVPTYQGGPMAPGGGAGMPPQVASIPPSAPMPSPRLIPVDRNPKLTAELTEARQRGAVVSVAITVRNPGEARQRLEFTGKDNYLLDYAEGKKYELVAMQGRRTLELGPNEQAVLRATFRAPQNASSVAVVIEEIGTFDDVPIVK